MTESDLDRRAATILPAGTPAPDFALNAAPDKTLRLSELRGRPVILVFYPADWSPVCGDQVALYNEILPEFREYGAELLGISVDSAWCHAAFAKDRKLRFPLLADFEPKGAVARLLRCLPPAGWHERARALRARRRRDHSLELLLADRREPWCRRHPERSRITRRQVGASKG